MDIKKFLLFSVVVLCPSLFVNADDGDVITLVTDQNVEMVFKVLDEENKILQVGTGECDNVSAVPYRFTGDLIIPAEINGYKVKSIGDYAFRGTSVTNVIISEGIEKIGDKMFYGRCRNLVSVTIPSTVSEIGIYEPVDGYECFCEQYSKTIISDIGSWCGVKKNGGCFWRNLYIGDNLISEIEIPQGVTTIEARTFAITNVFDNIKLPSSLKKICHLAFNMSTLYLDDPSKCIIPTLVIPENVDTIESYAFSSKIQCDSLIFKGGVKYIGKSAFRYFTECELILPEGTENVCEYAFDNNNNIELLSLPSTLTKLGKFAFNDMKSIKNILSYNENPPVIDKSSFGSWKLNYGVDSGDGNSDLVIENPDNPSYGYETAKLFVPRASIEKYKTTENWKRFKEIYAIEDFDTINGIDNLKAPNKTNINNSTYDLQGRRLSAEPSHGIYIKDGKKIAR